MYGLPKGVDDYLIKAINGVFLRTVTEFCSSEQRTLLRSERIKRRMGKNNSPPQLRKDMSSRNEPCEGGELHLSDLSNHDKKGPRIQRNLTHMIYLANGRIPANKEGTILE